MEQREFYANGSDRGGYCCVISIPPSRFPFVVEDFQSAFSDGCSMYDGLIGIHT